jgi:hypothetical protein
MITGNKGEWSEIYALFKLLSDKKLYAGDSDMNRIEDIFYPIVKIIRNESNGNFEYGIDDDLVIISGEKEELRIPIQTFTEQAAKLLSTIKKEKGIFAIPEIEKFMHSVYCQSLKAKSTTKTDIKIVIHDKKINQFADLGFSIKSQLGGESTLLNAGRTTNFIYLIENFLPTEEQIKFINTIDTRSKIKDRIDVITKQGGQFLFKKLENSVFNNNLVLIDSLLPNILSEILFLFFTSTTSTISDLTNVLTEINPLNYDNQHAHKFYEYKVKHCLTDIALGMMPSKVWSGIYDATGGYLIVKETGEVLCYHIYNRNEFENYLFTNTKLETASSTRHDFGKIYKENNQILFKLNLQIRFK